MTRLLTILLTVTALGACGHTPPPDQTTICGYRTREFTTATIVVTGTVCPTTDREWHDALTEQENP